jgi:hypothetical protein
MKNAIMLFGMLLISFMSFGQSDTIDVAVDEPVRFDLILADIYSELDVSDLQTEFLLDKSPSFSEKLLELNGTINNDTLAINSNQFDAFYSTIRDFATVRPTNLPTTNQMLDYSLASSPYNELGFRILFADYNRIRESAVDENLLYGESGKIKRRRLRGGNSPFLKEKIVISAPFRNSIITNGTVRFNFNNNLKYTNNNNTIDKLEIDFNDGAGYIDVTHSSQHAVSYVRSGSKIITCKITFKDEVFYSKSTLLVKGIENFQAKSTLFGQCYDHRIDISVPQVYADSDGLNNNTVVANAYIRYGCGNNNQLRKPIIFVEGIDFGEKSKYYGDEEFYDGDCGQLNRYGSFGWNHFANGDYDGVGNIAILPDALQKLHSDGHDVILLDFKAGATHIENNAATLIYLLNYINGKLTENNSDEQTIVTGISMGGQVARYALRKMENENINHNVSTFVSIDSPNYGANIPLGLQYNIRFAAFSFVGKLQPALLRPATKQLLLYHYEASAKLGIVNLGLINWNKIKPLPHQLHTNLYNSVHMTTFPQNCRNVAISNGSKAGLIQGYQEGDVVLSNLSTNVIINQSIKSWAMLSDGDKISRCTRVIYTFGLLPPIPYRLAVRTVSAKTYDHIPGGYRTTSQDLVDGLSDLFLNTSLQIKKQHAFIPTFSGLGIHESYKEADLPATLGSSYPYNHNPSLSPFDVIYADAVNHKHVFMNALNTEFLMEEYSPNTKYVQNKTYLQGIDTHSARDEVVVGKDIDPVPNRSLVGEVISTNAANTTFYAGKKVTFRPGVKFNNSSGRTHAYIREYCDYTQGIFKVENPVVSNHLFEKNAEEKNFNKENQKQQTDIRLYPNPNKGTFTIDLNTTMETVEVYNLYGQKVMHLAVNATSTVVNLKNLKAGIYVCKITTRNQQTIVKKIIRE